MLPVASTSQSSDSTPVESDKGKSKSEDASVPICPSCKSNLHNNRVMFRKSGSLARVAESDEIKVMKPCAHVVCKVCVDELVRAAKQCIVCDHTLADDDIIELKREGTFRNSFWPFVTRSDSVICQALDSPEAVLRKQRRRASRSRVDSTRPISVQGVDIIVVLDPASTI